MNRSGFTILSRFELKYHVPLARLPDIAAFLEPWCEMDAFCKTCPDGFYWITNLYLDNLQRTFFKWAEGKPDGRYNMRVRTYGENPGEQAVCHFEVKEKRRDVVVKTRGTIRGGHPERLWEDSQAVLASAQSLEERENLELFLRRSLSYGAGPVLQTQYRRIAWFGRFEDYARVTVDTGMRWRAVEGFELSVDPSRMRASDLPEYCDPGTDAVLELKCERGQVPWWMLDLIRFLDLRLSGYSKFASASREELRLPGVRIARGVM